MYIHPVLLLLLLRPGPTPSLSCEEDAGQTWEGRRTEQSRAPEAKLIEVPSLPQAPSFKDPESRSILSLHIDS